MNASSLALILLLTASSAQALPKIWEEGDYDATVATYAVDRDAVAKMLPAGMELAPAPGFEGTHPVILMAGLHQNVKPYINGVEGIAFYPTYHSLALGIPLTRLKKRPASHAGETFFYLAQLSVDNMAAYAAAKAAFGIPMSLVEVHDSQDALRAWPKWESDQVLSIDTWKDDANAPGAVQQNFAKVQKAWLSARMISPSRSGLKCSDLDWNLKTAKIDSVHAKARVFEGFTDGKGFAHGVSELVNDPAQTLSQHELGTFRLRSHWKHGTPYDCY